MKYLLVILSFTIYSFANASSFSGEGSGTEDDPYQITTYEQLREIKIYYEYYYILMNDIDADSKAPWTPIGEYSQWYDYYSFIGHLDGQNHEIKNLYIYMPDTNSVGLFGYVRSNATIKNLKLVNCKISGKNMVGGLVGLCEDAEISNVYVSGTVSGYNSVGGLIGSGKARIKNCISSVTVEGDDDVGGLVGLNSGRISNCSTDKNVYGHNRVGGLIGNNSANIDNVSATGEVTGFGDYVGGLIGVHSKEVISAFATGEVYGDDYIGGLIGDNYGMIEKTYALGKVSGDMYVGGLTGSNDGTYIKLSYYKGRVSGDMYVGGFSGFNITLISKSYAIGEVRGTSSVGGFIGLNESIFEQTYSACKVKGEEKVGGFIGEVNWRQDVQDSFWDVQVSGVDTSADAVGQLTSDMKTLAIFENAGWNFEYTWSIDPEINDGYPYLQWQYDETAVNESLSLKNIQIKIFPNPATDKINIILPKEAQVNFIRISDISGREVKSVSINSYTDNISMNISELPQGFYIINLYSGAEVCSCAFVVE